MEKRKIKDLKRGDYFTLTPVKEPNISQVWVRGEYIPQAKCYSTYKWENINHEVIRRETKKFTLISPSNHQRYGTEKI